LKQVQSENIITATDPRQSCLRSCARIASLPNAAFHNSYQDVFYK